MNNKRPEKVSVVDPLTPAINRVKLMLFQPFDIGKWFVIGFCAWLAFLGSGGGGGGGGGPQGNFHGGNGKEVRQAFDAAKEFFIANAYWIVPVVVFVVVLGIILWFVLTWLSSRGRFMFLHCVAGNKAEVKIPWAKFRAHANSLFVFRIVLALIGFVVILLPVIFTVLLIMAMVSSGAPAVGPIIGIVFLVLCITILSICFGLIDKFTMDFVVPIMFLQTTSVRAAWREFMTILSVNKARFVLYLLFQIVIGMAIGVILMMGICCTFCCLACILAIPYLGTVLYLPVFIFERSYSLYYLQQYGPQYDVFGHEDSQPVLTANSY
jgi:hypothetical protein